MSSPTKNDQSVPEIIAHEAKEHARLQAEKTRMAGEVERAMHEDEKNLKDEETQARAEATTVLQAFGAEDIPAMLEAGVASRTNAVTTVDEHARKELPAVSKMLVEKAVSGSLLF